MQMSFGKTKISTGPVRDKTHTTVIYSKILLLARTKVTQLGDFVREMDHDGRVLDVVPTSGKYG